MKIAVIEDQMEQQQLLLGYLASYAQTRKVEVEIDTFLSGEALFHSSYESYNIIFIDVYLTGMNGLDIAKKIRETDEEKILIFSTTSKDFAVDSYRVNAFDYLLKPYQDTLLFEVMDRCIKQLECKSNYIQVKEGRIMVKVLLKDIIYTDYSNHYIQIHLAHRMIRSYMPFEAFAPLLLAYPQYINCYRNCIINMDCVNQLDITDFLLKNGERIPIARNKRADIRKQYADYLFSKLESGL